MVMSLIESLTEIKNAVYGREVREAIHDGVFRANQIADETKGIAQQTEQRQGTLERYTDQMLIEMTDKDVISAPEIIAARGGKPTLQARLDEIEVIKSVHSFGAKGNGVDSDVDAIILGSQSGVTLGFPDGAYVIDSHLLVENKRNLKWVALGDEVTFLDKCFGVIKSDGSEGKAPFGIKFKNCKVTLENFDHTNLIVNNGGRISDAESGLIKPQIDFEGGDITINDFRLSGMVQPYIDSSNLLTDPSGDGALEVMRASYVRFYNCDWININGMSISEGAGGGEFISFYNCKNISYVKPTHDQSLSPVTFWSFAKVIKCGRFIFSDAVVKSKSTGSFVDVSGDNIEWNNLDIDMPNGKFIDVTQEWGYGNFDTKRVEVKNSKTNADLLVFSAIGSGVNLKLIDEVIVDRIDWNPVINNPNRPIINNRFIKKARISNMTLSNIPFFNIVGAQPLVENELFMSDVNLSYTQPNSAGRVISHASGLVEISDSTLGFGFYNELHLIDIINHLVTGQLYDSKAKFVFKNTTIKNTVIKVSANIEFIDCELIDVMIDVASDSVYPDIIFDNTHLSYTSESRAKSGFVPFRLSAANNLIFKNGCTMTGDLYAPGGNAIIGTPLYNIRGTIDVAGLSVDVRKVDGSGNPELSGLALMSVVESGIKRDVKINFKGVMLSNAIRYGISYVNSGTSIAHTVQFVLENNEIIKSSSSTARQLIRFNNQNVQNVELLSMSNKYVLGDDVSIIDWESWAFKFYKDTGSIVW